MIIDLSFVDIMKADGVSLEEIFQTLVKAVSVANEKQKQASRERQKRHRQRRNGYVTVTRNGYCNGDKQNQALKLGTEIAILPIVSKKERKIGIHKQRLRARLPTNWELSEDYITFARKLGMGEVDIRLEGEKFKDHWLANGEPKVDWLATWRNWCRNSRRYNHPSIAKPKNLFGSIL